MSELKQIIKETVNKEDTKKRYTAYVKAIEKTAKKVSKNGKEN